MLQMALVVRKRGLTDVLLPSSKHSFSVLSLLFLGYKLPPFIFSLLCTYSHLSGLLMALIILLFFHYNY